MTRFCVIALAVVLLGNGTTLAEPDKEPQKKPTAQKAQGQKKAAINAKLEGLFKSFDTNGDGSLSLEEFAAGFGKLQVRKKPRKKPGAKKPGAKKPGAKKPAAKKDGAAKKPAKKDAA